MARTDYQRLVDRGRKAGLGTSELYRALITRRPAVGDQPSQADSNGFVCGLGSNGQPIFHPVARQPS